MSLQVFWHFSVMVLECSIATSIAFVDPVLSDDAYEVDLHAEECDTNQYCSAEHVRCTMDDFSEGILVVILVAVITGAIPN